MSRTYAELYDEFMKRPLVYAQEPPRVAVEVDYWRGGSVRVQFPNVNFLQRHKSEAEKIRNQFVGREQTHRVLDQMEYAFNAWLEQLRARGEIYWDGIDGMWQGNGENPSDLP